ncbi:hypothetical protein MKW98_031445 [Papaver atlanticum]|uniref:Uncharacterized protein n=1 Tax=Papaver atlanticum TaxID=357466 RepID=A0AAD4S5V4_9MAGN|nr:hypothetical protein MKW98_031445 [Papaver atlanticum]
MGKRKKKDFSVSRICKSKIEEDEMALFHHSRSKSTTKSGINCNGYAFYTFPFNGCYKNYGNIMARWRVCIIRSMPKILFSAYLEDRQHDNNR